MRCPFSTKASSHLARGGQSGFWRGQLPLRDSAGLTPVFPHCALRIRATAHLESGSYAIARCAVYYPHGRCLSSAKTAQEQAPKRRVVRISVGLATSNTKVQRTYHMTTDPPSPPTTQTIVDQMGRVVTAPVQPQRIISLVPSQTELLFELGLAGRVVGRTRFCVHPADQVRSVPVVGGTKQFNFEAIDRLQPDLIIGNKEENYAEGILRLAQSYPVWMSNVITLADALDMIRHVGQLVNRAEQADALAVDIQTRLQALPALHPPHRVAYLIWQKPFMAAGPGTFIDAMLAGCGLHNVFSEPGRSRYPEVTLSELAAARPDLVFLSSEPFPFRETHRQALQAELPGAAVLLVDGEMFSWYGSRLRLAADYLARLVAELNPLRGASQTEQADSV